MTVTDQPVPHPAANRQFLRLATVGSVDDGKSTLIGRILHDTGSLPTDHIESVTGDDRQLDLAALSDGLRAEREQGITIDVAYRFFSTDTRSYVLADTPATSGTPAIRSPGHRMPMWRWCLSTPSTVCSDRPAGMRGSPRSSASNMWWPRSTRSIWWISPENGSPR